MARIIEKTHQVLSKDGDVVLTGNHLECKRKRKGYERIEPIKDDSSKENSEKKKVKSKNGFTKLEPKNKIKKKK